MPARLTGFKAVAGLACREVPARKRTDADRMAEHDSPAVTEKRVGARLTTDGVDLVPALLGGRPGC